MLPVGLTPVLVLLARNSKNQYGFFKKDFDLKQAFLFDLFLASRPSEFAETLSFLIKLLSFSQRKGNVEWFSIHFSEARGRILFCGHVDPAFLFSSQAT